MSTIIVDESTIDAAADLVSLLAVCTFTTQRMADGDEVADGMAGEVVRCLRWAESLAKQTHDDIAMLRRIQLDDAA